MNTGQLSVGLTQLEPGSPARESRNPRAPSSARRQTLSTRPVGSHARAGDKTTRVACTAKRYHVGCTTGWWLRLDKGRSVAEGTGTAVRSQPWQAPPLEVRAYAQRVRAGGQRGRELVVLLSLPRSQHAHKETVALESTLLRFCCGGG